jgi:hypothetical protein
MRDLTYFAAPAVSGLNKIVVPRRIVVVEDVFVRKFLRVALERLGHVAICAMPVEAVRLIQGGEVDLLVTNTPAEFAEVGEMVPLLYVAAFPDPAAAAGFRRWLALRKPFQTGELSAAVEQLLASG